MCRFVVFEVVADRFKVLRSPRTRPLRTITLNRRVREDIRLDTYY